MCLKTTTKKTFKISKFNKNYFIIRNLDITSFNFQSHFDANSETRSGYLEKEKFVDQNKLNFNHILFPTGSF